MHINFFGKFINNLILYQSYLLKGISPTVKLQKTFFRVKTADFPQNMHIVQAFIFNSSNTIGEGNKNLSVNNYDLSFISVACKREECIVHFSLGNNEMMILVVVIRVAVYLPEIYIN